VKQIHKHRLPYLREYAPPRAEVYEGTYSLNTIKNKSSSMITIIINHHNHDDDNDDGHHVFDDDELFLIVF